MGIFLHNSGNCFTFAQLELLNIRMLLVVNPEYESERVFFETLPLTFAQSGEVIYDARNQIRLIDGWVVKRFHCPRGLNAFIYGFLRKSKAQRSYENGLYCLRHGVATPEPAAYMEESRFGLLGYSYLVTRPAACTRLHREFTLAYTPDLDDTIRPLARFTAHMHEEGILHLDFSPGNILWDRADGEYRFEIVDINRMRFGKVSMKEGCRSMRRICARSRFFDIFADEYAAVRGFNGEECRHWIHYYRNRFWNYGKKARYEYD